MAVAVALAVAVVVAAVVFHPFTYSKCKPLSAHLTFQVGSESCLHRCSRVFAQRINEGVVEAKCHAMTAWVRHCSAFKRIHALGHFTALYDGFMTLRTQARMCHRLLSSVVTCSVVRCHKFCKAKTQFVALHCGNLFSQIPLWDAPSEVGEQPCML